MKFKIICRCSCEFTLDSHLLNTSGDIKCPNCGKALPDKVSDELRNCISSYEKAACIIRNHELYELSL